MPVINFSNNSFKSIKCDTIMEQIHQIYIQNIVRTGFDTIDVINRKALENVTDEDIR